MARLQLLILLLGMKTRISPQGMYHIEKAPLDSNKKQLIFDP